MRAARASCRRQAAQCGATARSRVSEQQRTARRGAGAGYAHTHSHSAAAAVGELPVGRRLRPVGPVALARGRLAVGLGAQAPIVALGGVGDTRRTRCGCGVWGRPLGSMPWARGKRRGSALHGAGLASDACNAGQHPSAPRAQASCSPAARRPGACCGPWWRRPGRPSPTSRGASPHPQGTCRRTSWCAGCLRVQEA